MMTMMIFVIFLLLVHVDAFQPSLSLITRTPTPTTTTTTTASLTTVRTLFSTRNTQLYMHNKNNNNNNKKTTTTASKGFGGSSTTNAKAVIDKFPYSGIVRPGTISPQRRVDDPTISKPDYWDTGRPIRTGRNLLPWAIEVKTTKEMERMKESGYIARRILDGAGKLVAEGITTDEIDAWVHNEIIKNKAYPSPLNYHGFPKSCCTSVNEVICHGIPDDRKLNKGEIINLDITVYYNGYHGDCSEMFVVGGEDAISTETKQLLQTTYDCWISACSIVKPGVDYKEIGTVIEDYIIPRGYSTVRQFCGHGIGSVFHTNPNILHYKNNEPNGQMAVGHTFTIEPMICEGMAKSLTWPDEWTATTVDGKLSAQFEHTLLVTPDGVEALTGKHADSPIQFWERDSTIHKGIWLGTSATAQQRMDEINSLRLQ